jgi:hypothetical protein
VSAIFFIGFLRFSALHTSMWKKTDEKKVLQNLANFWFYCETRFLSNREETNEDEVFKKSGLSSNPIYMFSLPEVDYSKDYTRMTFRLGGELDFFSWRQILMNQSYGHWLITFEDSRFWYIFDQLFFELFNCSVNIQCYHILETRKRKGQLYK